VDNKKDIPGAMSGQTAFEEMQRRLLGPRGPKTVAVPVFDPESPLPREEGFEVEEDDAKGLDDLIQVNIETIDCRFSDDLSAVWKQMGKKVTGIKKGHIRPLPQADQPPRGKGWLVEIRGYTFHRDSANFLMETFVQNLFEKGLPDYSEDGTAPLPPPAAPKPNPEPAKPPVGQPATNPAPAAAKPVEEKAVVNRISHVVLYNVASTQTSEQQGFKLAGTSVLDPLLKACAERARVAALPQPKPPTPVGPTGTTPGTTIPLGTEGNTMGKMPKVGVSGKSAGKTPSGETQEEPSGKMPKVGVSGKSAGKTPSGETQEEPSGKMPAVGKTGTSASKVPPVEEIVLLNRERWMPLGCRGQDKVYPQQRWGEPALFSSHKRTEFVILFVWKEHSALDTLLASAASKPPQIPTQTMKPPGSSMPGQGLAPGGMKR